jgi:hypothetical protein
MRFVGILFFAALGLLGQDVVKDGSDWVRRQSGFEAAPLQAVRIEVHAQGGIVVRESPDNRLSYTFTQRIPVGTRTEAQAQQLLGGGLLRRVLLPNGAMVVVADGSSGNVTTTLELGVPRHFSFAGLEVKYGGDISVYDFRGNVEAITPSGSIRGDRIHGSVSAKTGSGEIRFGTVEGSMECFTTAGSITIESVGGGVDCQTGGGQTTVKQAGGPVTLHADGGDISVERAGSSVDARSASGFINVGQAGGKVIAITRGGSIQVGPAHDVKAESGQGRIHVRGVSGPLSLSAAMGSIVAELLAGAQIQESSFTSRTGDITVRMPSNIAVSVMATEDSGGNPRIQSDFSELRANGFGWQRPPVVVQGAINGGGPVLHLNSSVIYLLKSK